MGKRHIPPHSGLFWAYSCTLPQVVQGGGLGNQLANCSTVATIKPGFAVNGALDCPHKKVRSISGPNNQRRATILVFECASSTLLQPNELFDLLRHILSLPI